MPGITEIPGVGLIPWAREGLMLGVCLTCMGVFGSGVLIGMIRIIIAGRHHRTRRGRGAALAVLSAAARRPPGSITWACAL